MPTMQELIDALNEQITKADAAASNSSADASSIRLNCEHVVAHLDAQSSLTSQMRAAMPGGGATTLGWGDIKPLVDQMDVEIAAMREFNSNTSQHTEGIKHNASHLLFIQNTEKLISAGLQQIEDAVFPPVEPPVEPPPVIEPPIVFPPWVPPDPEIPWSKPGPPKPPISIEPSPPSGDPPHLWCSDVMSGPKAGNSDPTFGQVDAGAYITVWGKRFGTQATVTCGAADCRVIHCGKAEPPWSMSNLANQWQRDDVIVFQVSPQAMDGPGQIVVKADGKVSNALPFTVRPGRIVYIAPTGIDGLSRGSWASPLRTINYAIKNFTDPGDTIYALEGTDYPTLLLWQHSGTKELPRALIAYPGAAVAIGAPNLQGMQFYGPGPAFASSIWCTVSKFRIQGGPCAVITRQGIRLAGNHLSAPNGTGATGGITGTATQSSVYLLANEISHVGNGDHNSLYHVIYFSGARWEGAGNMPAERDHKVHRNYLHDCEGAGGIHCYSFGGDGPGASYPTWDDPFSTNLCDYDISHNVTVNQYSPTIRAISLLSPVRIHHNLSVLSDFGHQISGSLKNSPLPENFPAGTFVDYNSIIDCRYALQLFGNSHVVLSRFKNNLTLLSTGGTFISTSLGGTKMQKDAAKFSHNLWRNAAGSAPPYWDSNTLSMDPLIDETGRLLEGSPMIGAGAELSDPWLEFDFDGRRRISFDVGAFAAP